MEKTPSAYEIPKKRKTSFMFSFKKGSSLQKLWFNCERFKLLGFWLSSVFNHSFNPREHCWSFSIPHPQSPFTSTWLRCYSFPHTVLAIGQWRSSPIQFFLFLFLSFRLSHLKCIWQVGGIPQQKNQKREKHAATWHVGEADSSHFPASVFPTSKDVLIKWHIRHVTNMHTFKISQTYQSVSTTCHIHSVEKYNVRATKSIICYKYKDFKPMNI